MLETRRRRRRSHNDTGRVVFPRLLCIIGVLLCSYHGNDDTTNSNSGVSSTTTAFVFVGGVMAAAFGDDGTTTTTTDNNNYNTAAATATTVAEGKDDDEKVTIATTEVIPQRQQLQFGHELLVQHQYQQQQEYPNVVLLQGRAEKDGNNGRRRGEFLVNYTNFNHGSFGACPISVLHYQSQLRLQQEQQPDPWMRIQYKKLLKATREKIAKHVHVPEANAENIVLLESASTAMNSILRSFPWHNTGNTNNKNSIAYFTTAYDMVKHTAEYLREASVVSSSSNGNNNNGLIDIIEIPVKVFPISTEMGYAAFLVPMQELLETLRDQNSLQSLRMIILDHIVSCPGIKTPIQELTAMIKQYAPETFVVVDGAHALGQIPNLNMTELADSGIDAYFSNGHKWFYTPKGSAFLWINNHSKKEKNHVTNIFPEPTVISSENRILQERTNEDAENNENQDNDTRTSPLRGNTTNSGSRSSRKRTFRTDHATNSNTNSIVTSFADRYEYTSTRDYTAMLCFDAALDFRHEVLGGDTTIYDYIRTLALTARRYLLKKWTTIALVPEYMEEFMINIVLPSPIDTPALGTELHEYLFDRYQMYTVIVHDVPSNLIYTRLSAQVYLELSDFVNLGDAVLEFVTTIETKMNKTATMIANMTTTTTTTK